MRSGRAVFAMLLLGVLTAGAAPLTVSAQHETADDLLDGERAYRNRCANCHGPDGDVIEGIDLARGQFRRPLSDDDLVRIIRTGIPDTPMPPTNVSVAQASQIVAYLHARAAAARPGAVRGDAARGRAIYDGAGGCAACHSVAGRGSGVGPDLTGIGAVRGALELEQSLVDPRAEVRPDHRFYRVVLQDGTVVTGRLLSHDSFTVQMLDTDERLRSFAKHDLREYGFDESPMPSFRDRLSAQELADLISYLVSLKGE